MPPKKQKPNEKCACGSGKKYKKCCGSKKTSSVLSTPHPSATIVAKLKNDNNYFVAVEALSTLDDNRIIELFEILEDGYQKKFLGFAKQKAKLGKEEFQDRLKRIIIRLKIIRLDKLFLKIHETLNQDFTDGDTLQEINDILSEFVINRTPLLEYLSEPIEKIQKWLSYGLKISKNLNISKEKVKASAVKMKASAKDMEKIGLALKNIKKMGLLSIDNNKKIQKLIENYQDDRQGFSKSDSSESSSKPTPSKSSSKPTPSKTHHVEPKTFNEGLDKLAQIFSSIKPDASERNLRFSIDELKNIYNLVEFINQIKDDEQIITVSDLYNNWIDDLEMFIHYHGKKLNDLQEKRRKANELAGKYIKKIEAKEQEINELWEKKQQKDSAMVEKKKLMMSEFIQIQQKNREYGALILSLNDKSLEKAQEVLDIMKKMLAKKDGIESNRAATELLEEVEKEEKEKKKKHEKMQREKKKRVEREQKLAVKKKMIKKDKKERNKQSEEDRQRYLNEKMIREKLRREEEVRREERQGGEEKEISDEEKAKKYLETVDPGTIKLDDFATKKKYMESVLFVLRNWEEISEEEEKKERIKSEKLFDTNMSDLVHLTYTVSKASDHTESKASDGQINFVVVGGAAIKLHHLQTKEPGKGGTGHKTTDLDVKVYCPSGTNIREIRDKIYGKLQLELKNPKVVTVKDLPGFADLEEETKTHIVKKLANKPLYEWKKNYYSLYKGHLCGVDAGGTYHYSGCNDLNNPLKVSLIKIEDRKLVISPLLEFSFSMSPLNPADFDNLLMLGTEHELNYLTTPKLKDILHENIIKDGGFLNRIKKKERNVNRRKILSWYKQINSLNAVEQHHKKVGAPITRKRTPTRKVGFKLVVGGKKHKTRRKRGKKRTQKKGTKKKRRKKKKRTQKKRTKKKRHRKKKSRRIKL